MTHFKAQVAVLPWQKADLKQLGLSEQEAATAAWWLEAGGRRLRGHRAIGAALQASGGFWRLVGALLLAPAPLSWPLAWGYALVSRWRRFLPGLTPACRTSYPWDSARDQDCRAARP